MGITGGQGHILTVPAFVKSHSNAVVLDHVYETHTQNVDGNMEGYLLQNIELVFWVHTWE